MKGGRTRLTHPLCAGLDQTDLRRHQPSAVVRRQRGRWLWLEPSLLRGRRDFPADRRREGFAAARPLWARVSRSAERREEICAGPDRAIRRGQTIMFVVRDKVGGLRRAGKGAGLVVCGYLEGSSQFGDGLFRPERVVGRLTARGAGSFSLGARRHLLTSRLISYRAPASGRPTGWCLRWTPGGRSGVSDPGFPSNAPSQRTGLTEPGYSSRHYPSNETARSASVALPLRGLVFAPLALF